MMNQISNADVGASGCASTLMFEALDHIGFTVSDLDRSADWYTRLLGYGPHVRRAVGPGYIGQIVGYADCRMDWALWRLPNNTALELIHYIQPKTAWVDMETRNVGNAHLCLVTHEMDAVHERMRGHAEFRSPRPVEVTAGPYRGARAWYLRDPDGVTVELMEPLPATRA